MDIKYSQAIKAGIIGGIIVAILILIKFGIDIIGALTYSFIGFAGCCVWLLEVAMLLATGALAVYFLRELRDLNDALLVGAIAGGVAGLIAAATSVVVVFITPFVQTVAYNGDMITAEALGIAGIFSLLSGVGGTCCCAPVWVAVSIILGAIGAAIYFSIRK